MSFKIPNFIVPGTIVDHNIYLDDFLDEFDVEDVLKVLAKQRGDFMTDVFEFIESATPTTEEGK